MMYIPLNCAIIIQLYIDCGGNSNLVPKTMTQLYTALCRSLIRRYIKQKNLKYKSIPDVFKDLPSDILGPFTSLARIAFEKLKLNELVFSLPDEDNVDHMGFMNVSIEMYVDSGVHQSYNFLHPSIQLQEYLAAWHICQMGDKCKIRENFYLSFDLESKLDVLFEEDDSSDTLSIDSEEHDDMDHLGLFKKNFLQSVLVFMHGFLGSTLKENLLFYNKLCCGVCEWSSFHSRKDYFFNINNHKVVWQLIRYLFEAQSPQLCIEVLNNTELQVGISSPVDCHMFSYCYVNCNAQWHVCFTSSEYLQLLKRLVMHWNQKNNIWATIKSIAFKYPWHMEQLSVLQSISKTEYLSELHLKSCSMTSANCAILATAIHTCPNLKTLDISNSVIGAGGGVSLFAALCNLQVLESLHVTNCKLGLEDAKSLNHLLRTASILYKISIGDNVPFNLAMVLTHVGYPKTL